MRLASFRLSQIRRYDETLGRLVRNCSYLLTANMLSALLGIASLTLAARVLGPEAFGVLALSEAYIRLVDLLVRLEPWQAVIKFGAAQLEHDKVAAFHRLVKISTLVDLAGAMASALVAVALAILCGHLFGWDDRTRWIAILFSFANLTHLSATPTGVLRLFNRFDLLSYAAVSAALVRLACLGVAAMIGSDIYLFLAVFMMSHALEGLVPLVLGWRELRRHHHGGAMRVPLRGLSREVPELWSFIWTSNVSLTVRNSTQYLDTLFIGGIVDPAAAGLYQVAKRIGLAVLKIGQPVQQAIYPDVARLYARGQTDILLRVVLQVTAIIVLMGIACLAALALGGQFIVRLLGPGYVGILPLIVLQTLSAVMFLAGMGLRPALLSMGLHRSVMLLTIVCTALFYLWMLLAVPMFGAIGATLAHVLFNTAWLIATGYLFITTLWRMGRAAPASPARP